MHLAFLTNLNTCRVLYFRNYKIAADVQHTFKGRKFMLVKLIVSFAIFNYHFQHIIEVPGYD